MRPISHIIFVGRNGFRDFYLIRLKLNPITDSLLQNLSIIVHVWELNSLEFVGCGACVSTIKRNFVRFCIYNWCHSKWYHSICTNLSKTSNGERGLCAKFGKCDLKESHFVRLLYLLQILTDLIYIIGLPFWAVFHFSQKWVFGDLICKVSKLSDYNWLFWSWLADFIELDCFIR